MRWGRIKMLSKLLKEGTYSLQELGLENEDY